ncbi:hypothetical protein ACZ90_34575 [Streptomyces albus subsp. albus]|nr:hypothetical protein ACZ90_34575 [Streptomyces albus subsp. albus]
MLTLSDSRLYFELCYAAALVVSILFLLGWRTRAVSVLFAVVVASFHARSIFMTDGGDNLVLLMALYLTLTASGRRWSLDALRARRAPSGRRLLPLPLLYASGTRPCTCLSAFLVTASRRWTQREAERHALTQICPHRTV